MDLKKTVDPALYSEEYFLTDNEGCLEYEKGLDSNIHTKFQQALKIASPSSKDSVLDLGCGRGELIYYCAKKGARALGIDYSPDAVRIAKRTIGMLPDGLRAAADAEVGDVASYDFHEKFTIVFMIEVVEHVYDWQLAEAFKRVHGILADGGRLIIITPNYYYEKYLLPLKRIVNIPFNLLKWPVRILKGKYRPKNANEMFRKIFKVKVDRGELNRVMHVNITTPAKLKKMLSGFDVDMRCEDHSKNILSLLTQKWCGRDIVIVARVKHGVTR
jgi:2-polyprenyl-3-methyl-5-hydroxy-6-metoxy-1,4-benzoquinol methylase